MAQAKKSPGAAATATGANCFEKAVVEPPYPGNTTRAIVQIIEAAESGDTGACNMALRSLRRLPALQVATIAALVLGSLDEDTAQHVVEATLRAAGYPLPDEVAPMVAAR